MYMWSDIRTEYFFWAWQKTLATYLTNICKFSLKIICYLISISANCCRGICIINIAKERYSTFKKLHI